MKRLFLFAVISAMITITTNAQVQQQPPQQQPQKDMKADRADWDKKVKDELKLNAEQTQKYDAVSKEYSDKIDAVVNDASLSKEAQKERKMALKKEKESRLAEFLTPEQQAKYSEIAQKKHKMK